MNDIIDYDVLMPDHMGKLQRLQVVVADQMTMEIVIQRVIDGESLRQIAMAWKLPVTRFIKWISDDEKRLAEYEGALRIRADELVHSALITAETGEDVSRDKLIIDTGLKVAAMWDKQRYGGEKTTGGAGITIVINRGGGEIAEDNTVVIDG